MPKHVDHESRRAELGSAVWSVVAKHGIEAVTIREVARESGWSTGVVNHYFRDKEDLMQYAFYLSIERSVARLLAHAADAPPLEALRIILLESLAITKEQRLENSLWAVFVGQALTNPEMSDEVRSLYQRWLERLVRLIKEGQRDGSIRRGFNTGEWARRAMATVDGYVIQTFYLPGGDQYLDEQIENINRLVDSLRARSGPTRTTGNSRRGRSQLNSSAPAQIP